MVRSLINVKDYGAKADGVTDDTVAIRNAVTDVTSPGTTVGFPMGYYRITDTITITHPNTHIVGAGRWATQINFYPTSEKTLFEFNSDGSPISECSIRNLGIYSATAYKKVAIKIVDGNEFTIENVGIKGWTGNASVGVQIFGRDIVRINNFRCYADQPIFMGENPNDLGNTADHYHFSDIFLVALDDTQNCIEIGPDLGCSNFTISGYASLCYGKHGIYQNDTAPGGFRNTGWHFSDIRREHSEDANAYTIYINHPLETLLLDHIRCAVDGQGIYLRQMSSTTLQNCFYDGNGKSLNMDSSSENILLQNFQREGTSTMTTTGLTRTFNQPPIEIWQPS